MGSKTLTSISILLFVQLFVTPSYAMSRFFPWLHIPSRVVVANMTREPLAQEQKRLS